MRPDDGVVEGQGRPLQQLAVTRAPEVGGDATFRQRHVVSRQLA